MPRSLTFTAPGFVATAMVALVLGCGSSNESDGPARPGLDAGVVGDGVVRADSSTTADLAVSSGPKDASRADSPVGIPDAALVPDAPLAMDRPQVMDAASSGVDGDGTRTDVAMNGDTGIRIPPSDGAVATDGAVRPVDANRDLVPSVDSLKKADLPPGALAIGDYEVMPLSNFPYQCFVKNWDDKGYPVFFALIQSASDFDACFGAAGVMGASKPYTPTDKDFSTYSYIVVFRVVPTSPVKTTFTVDALMAAGGEVGLSYTLKQSDGSATSSIKDGFMVAFPKRKIDQVVVYENHVPLGILDSAAGKNDVTQN